MHPNSFDRILHRAEALGPIAIAVIYFAIGIFVFSPALSGDFIWDDWAYVVGNPLLDRADALRAIWLTKSTPDPWPITYTVFLLLKQMFGAEPLGYHVVSLVLHCLNAFLVFLILRECRWRHALLASLLFLIHPVNTESVAWVFQIKTLLAFTFASLAILSWQQKRSLFLTLTFFLLSLLTKPVFLALPGFALASWYLQNKKPSRKELVLFISGTVMSLALVILNLNWYAPLDESHPIRTDGTIGKILGLGWTAWFYIYKALIPAHLVLIYEKWSFPEINGYNWIPTAALILLLMAIVFRPFKMSQTMRLGLTFWFLAILPVLGLVDILFMRFSLVSDHWQYPAILGILVAVSPWLAKSRIAAALVIGAFATTSFIHAGEFRRDTIFLKAIARNPQAAIAHDLLGLEYLRAQKLDLALEQFNQSLRIRPDANAYFNRGIIFDARGDIEQARQNYEKADQINPRYPKNLSNWGVVLLKIGRVDEAIEKFSRAVTLEPENPTYQFNWQLAKKRKQGPL